jgi:2-dehydro-3-deoxygluconokinase
MAKIVTFGEAMIRLAPPHFQRLEQARSLDVEVGGAELNTSVALARLGHQVSWVSRLPDNPLGQVILNRSREAGVDTTQVQLVNDGRCGLYFLEFGAAPRSSSIMYDRQESSFARVNRDDFHWLNILNGASWFHVSGITPALSNGAEAATALALQTARMLNIPTSIDLNYRSKLWTPQDAGRVMSELLTFCDTLFATENDALQLFDIRGNSFAEVAGELIERFGLKQVVGVKRETPLVWRNRFGAVGYADGSYQETPWYDVEIVDRLGAGDALAAGVIHGLLQGNFTQGLEFGAALGALKHSIPGDLPYINMADIEAVLSGHGLRIQR